MFEAQKVISSGNLELKTRNDIQEALNYFVKRNINYGIQHSNYLIQEFDKETSKTRQKLINNKKKIHNVIYENKLKRCPLHEDLYTECVKMDEIKRIIETPKIFGFVMYKFPEKNGDSEENKVLRENKEYNLEINKIRSLIEEINKNKLINIKFPEEITSLGIKTYNFL